MRVVCVTDMLFRVLTEERVHFYFPFMLAFLRPEWEVHAYYLSSNEDVSIVEREYGKSVPNFHVHFYEHDDTETLKIVDGDMLLIVGAIPSANVSYNNLLLDIESLRKRYSVVVYYALDNWEGWWLGKWCINNVGKYLVPDVEYKIMSAADYTLAVSPQLCLHLNTKYRYPKPVYWIPNAANLRRYKLDAPFQFSDKIVCVYLGTLFWARSDKNDWDATLRTLASEFPNIQFYIIGTFAWGDTPKPLVPYYKNMLPIINKGWRAEIAAICKSATFFLILGGRNPFTYFCDPTKWYVYHAMERPILSLNIPHHARFAQIYPSTITHHDLLDGVREMLRALERGLTPAPPNPNHDWIHRAQTFLDIFERGEIGYGCAAHGAWETGRLP